MKFLYLLILLLPLMVGCGEDSSSSEEDEVGDMDDDDEVGGGDDDDDEEEDDDEVLNTAHFRSMISATTVACELSNGSNTTCHQLTFAVNNIKDGSNGDAAVDDENGPFCPTTVSADDGGVGIYDGTTGPGFQRLSETLFDNMAIDGYDLIDEGPGGLGDTVCVQDLYEPSNGAGNPTRCSNYCLTSSPDAAANALTVTFLVPVTPENLTTGDDVIGTVEHLGLSLDGVHMTGAPPSVVGTMGMGSIPSLDACGGHHDPAGYYHWHFVPESMDVVLAAQSVAGVDCASMITQNSSALTGYAKDGYPVYAYQDAGNITPTDLDSCNGHTGATTEFPEGVYHYHASDTDASNYPPCLKGASVAQNLTPIVE